MQAKNTCARVCARVELLREDGWPGNSYSVDVGECECRSQSCRLIMSGLSNINKIHILLRFLWLICTDGKWVSHISKTGKNVYSPGADSLSPKASTNT